jgi:serine phosphatase RsbU (regulator of sigma subunit)
MICLLTDGFWEWENPEGEEFGKERVARVIEGRSQQSASLIIRELHQKAHGFARGTPQSDDLTAVIIKKT